MEPVVAIVGATGSGKSTAAMALARRRPQGEIISCDSVQVYQGFQIGSAKPSPEAMAEIRHHAVDMVPWNVSFDAAQFVEAVDVALPEIRRRGHRPIVCGGTFLYLRALRYGLVPMPKSDPEVRARLQQWEREHPGWAVERLWQVDPQSAQSVDLQNPVRVLRALEIFELTGEPASRLRRVHGFETERIPMRLLALRWPDGLLRERIAARAVAMVEQGLLAEVQALLDAGVDPQCRPMTSVGYREAYQVIAGLAPHEGLAQRIAHSTWQYARRQRTWLRKEPGVEWLDVDSDEAVVASVLTATV